MDRNINTDVTMIANNAFNKILSCVQDSGLNYQVQMSPFSATISLKKTLVKSLAGNPILPTISKKEVTHTIHEKELFDLKNSYDELFQKLEIAYKTIEELKNDKIDKDSKISNLSVTTSRSQNSANLLKNDFMDDVIIQKNFSMRCQFQNDLSDTSYCSRDFKSVDGANYEFSENYAPPCESEHRQLTYKNFSYIDEEKGESNYSDAQQNLDPSNPHMFSSLVAHWLPCATSFEPSTSVTFKAHCVNASKWKEELDDRNEILKGFQAILDKQDRMNINMQNCKQS